MPPIARLRSRSVALLVAAALCTSLASCNKPIVKPTTPIAPTFTGPSFMHQTIGSIATLRGLEPMLVSSYGLVVDLPNTGSSQVPAHLRQRIINDMRLRGVGSASMRRILPATPEEVLASGTAAVVALEGFVPPGATRGTRFDVLVSALPQTDTTSLEGGMLWTADLSQNGTNPENRFTRKVGAASGRIYLNPFDVTDSARRDAAGTGAEVAVQPDRDRQGVVVGGGVVTVPRRLEIYLNQPSWSRSRIIADRINERFKRVPGKDRLLTAEAKSDQLIVLNVPSRFQTRPQHFLDLVAHLYLQRGAGSEVRLAKMLADVASKKPEYAQDVCLAWQSIGILAFEVIRKHYGDPEMHVRLAALEAGANLGDVAILDSVEQLAVSPDAELRKKAAALLVHLPQSLRGAAALKALIDDDDMTVRIAAYESVSRIGDPELIQSTQIGGKDEFKFVLDLVKSKKPLIYITHGSVPRIVIFDSMLGFKTPSVAKLWGNRMMVRATEPNKLVNVFYQPSGQSEAKTVSIAPTVANFVLLMGNTPSSDSPMEGLDLTYSEVVNAVYTLAKQGDIDAPLEIRVNPLADAVAKAREAPESIREEFSPEGEEAKPAPATAKTGAAAGKSGAAASKGGEPAPRRSKGSTAARPEFSTPEAENGDQPVVR